MKIPTLLEDLDALVNDHTRKDCDCEEITAATYSRCLRIERLRAASQRLASELAFLRREVGGGNTYAEAALHVLDRINGNAGPLPTPPETP